MFYARVSRAGPDLVILTMCWEFVGETAKLSIGGNPSDWCYHHGAGKVRIKWADPDEVPDYWKTRFQDVYGKPFDNDEGFLMEPRGVVRFSASGTGVISTAETDDCWGSCIFAASSPNGPDMLRSVFGTEIGNSLIVGPDWDGVWTQPLDWVGENQVDPRTLTKVVNGGSFLLDQEVIQDAAYNDLMDTLGGGDG